MESVWADLLKAWRLWRRVPGTAVGIILLVGIGMGGVTALFSPLYALVLTPLPFPQSEQLVRIGGEIPLFDSYSRTFDNREQLAHIFSNVAAYAPAFTDDYARLSVAARPARVTIQVVTREFFETIGTVPRKGWGFAKERANSHGVVISDRLWRTELGAVSHVVGKEIEIGGRRFTVIGVMPEDFDFPAGTDMWIPMTAVSNYSSLQFVGRLRNGLSLGQGATALKAIAYRRGPGPSGKVAKEGPVLQSLQSFVYGDRRPLLWNLWAASGLFLLLTCAGAANLLLAHGVRRRTELGVRLAMGASRKRLVRQFLTETLLVVVAGGLLAMWLSGNVAQWLETQVPEMRGNHGLVPVTVALAALLTVAVTILCGLAPALHATGAKLDAMLKCRSNRAIPFTSHRRLITSRECLAAAQLALALVLLVGAGLLLRSLTERLNVPLGFRTDATAVIRAGLAPLREVVDTRMKFFQQRSLDPFGTYGPRRHRGLLEDLRRTLEPAQRAEVDRNRLFFRDAQQRLGGLPSVVSVGILNPAPFAAEATRAMEAPMDVYKFNPLAAGGRAPWVACILGSASANAFDVLGIHLVAGRKFDPLDVSLEAAVQEAPCPDCSISATGRTIERAGVAIINESLARNFWPNENAVAKRFYASGIERTVVGVVSDFHQSPSTLKVIPAAYVPFTGVSERSSFVVKLRSGARMTPLAVDVTRVLGELTPDLLPLEVQRTQDLAASTLGRLRFASALLTCFSLLGTILAGLGVYATATLMAADRTREMGLRIALGASSNQIRCLALWRSVRVALIAMPAGVVAAWAVARSLSHLLFQVATDDTFTYVTSSAFLLIIALAAGLPPALKAAWIAPADAIRCE